MSLVNNDSAAARTRSLMKSERPCPSRVKPIDLLGGDCVHHSQASYGNVSLEIIKRFPAIEYQQDQLSMFDIFGDEWRLLDKDARAQAEEWFQAVIFKKLLKGIVCNQLESGEYLYTRISNDKYEQDK